MASRREDYLRQLKEEKLLRLKRERYKTDPLFWLEDRFGESRESFAWSEIEGYEKHEWDGDKDPLAQAWQVLGDGYKKVRDGGIADFRYVAIESATGCHAKGTRVLMYDGSLKNVEDIIEGDLLMGDDSLPRTVLSLVRGRETMYRITSKQGDTFEVNANHILSLKKTPTPNKYKSKPEIINVSVIDYLSWSNHDKHLYKLYRTGVDFKARELPYEPYYVGAWIGDGTIGTSYITNIDKELIDYLYEYAARLGALISKRTQKDRTPSYLIHYGNRGLNKNPIKAFFSTCIIEGEKRIPTDYLINSRENRLKLLAGLIDTDGHLDTSKAGYSYTTIYRGLADDILYLCRSLGYTATCTYYPNDFKGSYRITISEGVS